jgi:hypothetical protein
VRIVTEWPQVIHLPRCRTDGQGARNAAPCARPVRPWSGASPLFPVGTDASTPGRRRYRGSGAAAIGGLARAVMHASESETQPNSVWMTKKEAS